MDTYSKYPLLLIYSLIHYLSIQEISANPIDYCEFGFCEPDEYCCGKDTCCKETSELWYFWIGVILVVATIIVATFVKYFLRNMERTRGDRRYEPVPNQIVEET